MKLLKQVGPFILSVTCMIFGTWVAADIGFPPSKFMLTYATVWMILAALWCIEGELRFQLIWQILFYAIFCLALIMPSCYGLLSRTNIVPVEFRNVYEDTVFSTDETVTLPYGEYGLRKTQNGEFEILHYDKSAGKYVTGPVETTVGIPDTLGECIDLQIECWQDDEPYRRVYYRETNTE